MVTPSAWPEEGPRRNPLTESQFSEVLSKEGVEYIQELEFLRRAGVNGWVERRLYTLYRKSTDLETFLDDHGAAANQTFFRVREYVAGTRWLAMTCSCLVHLRSRLHVYPPASPKWVEGSLTEHLHEAIDCFGGYLLRCTEDLSIEWVKVGLKWDDSPLDRTQEVLGPDFVLPANRLPEADERAEANQKDSLPAARVVGRVLRILNTWAPLASVATSTHEERRAFMEDFCSEATARDFESRVHNLQSDYDSTIRGSKEEQQFPELLQLRGAISQCLHLLEAVTALAHFYERHEVRQRHPATRRILEGIIDWEEFLDCMIRCCVLPALSSLLKAKPLGEKLLESLTTQAFKDVKIPPGVTLHARPLSLIVGVVHHYGLPVEIEIEDERASAASMMSMLVLCGSHLGADSIRFHGDPAVLSDLEALFEARLGEDGIDALPSRLKYLIR
jgi:phosphotransferase system HPr-like phosphotransfer protein